MALIPPNSRNVPEIPRNPHSIPANPLGKLAEWNAEARA
jgi:hypothetical protein